MAPEAGLAPSQLTPFWVELVTVKFKAAGLPVTAMVCAAGAAPPANWVKVRVVVGAERVPGSTLRCTLMVAGLFPAPGAVTTMVPLYVVPGVSLDPSTETVRVPLAEVLPLAGDTESQLTALLLLATAL